MICAIGIDSVEIKRFECFFGYSKKLRKIFDRAELAYCQQYKIKSAERFAVRFAAKEAFYKAFSAAFSNTLPFYTVARYAVVERTSFGAPVLAINWGALACPNSSYKTHVSLTHTKTVATAIVIIEKIR